MTDPFRPAPRPAALTVLALCTLAPALLMGCDSNDSDADADPTPDPQQTEFLVRYELTGVCLGIRSVAYNVTSGSTTTTGGGAAFTLPWSFEHTVSAPTSPTATALAATCRGSDGASQSITGRIIVDGEERATQTAEGQDQISLSIGTVLR